MQVPATAEYTLVVDILAQMVLGYLHSQKKTHESVCFDDIMKVLDDIFWKEEEKELIFAEHQFLCEKTKNPSLEWDDFWDNWNPEVWGSPPRIASQNNYLYITSIDSDL